MKNQEVVNSFDVTVWESLKALLGSGYIIERFTTALTLNSLECLVILQPKWMKSNEGVYSSGETLWENQKPRLGSCFVVKKSTTTLNLSILKYLEYSVGPTNGKPRCGLHFWRNFGKKWKNLSNRCFVVWESIAALTLWEEEEAKAWLTVLLRPYEKIQKLFWISFFLLWKSTVHLLRIFYNVWGILYGNEEKA